MEAPRPGPREVAGPRPRPARTRPRSVLVTLLAACGLAWLAYSTLLWATQRDLLYPGRGRVPPAGAADGVPGLERWWLATSVGEVEAWWLPPLDAHHAPSSDGALYPAVVFAHGNGEFIDTWPLFMTPYRRLGLGVLLVEYPGYGRSQGEPSEASIVETFVAAYDRLVALPRVDPRRIVLHGRSLGGGAVAALAEARTAAALVLQSAFTSVSAFAADMFVPGLLVRDPFDVLGPVTRAAAPVLVLHGRDDRVVPVRHAELLAAAAADGRLVLLPGGHDTMDGAWWQAIEAFLRDTGILQPAPAAPGSPLPDDRTSELR